MNKKILFSIAGGVCAAGVVCFIVGLIVYFTSIGKALPVIISWFTMATGVIITAIAAVVLIVMLIIHLITKSKNK